MVFKLNGIGNRNQNKTLLLLGDFVPTANISPSPSILADISYCHNFNLKIVNRKSLPNTLLHWMQGLLIIG